MKKLLIFILIPIFFMCDLSPVSPLAKANTILPIKLTAMDQLDGSVWLDSYTFPAYTLSIYRDTIIKISSGTEIVMDSTYYDKKINHTGFYYTQKIIKRDGVEYLGINLYWWDRDLKLAISKQKYYLIRLINDNELEFIELMPIKEYVYPDIEVGYWHGKVKNKYNLIRVN